MANVRTPLKDKLQSADEVDKQWSDLTSYRDIAMAAAAVLLWFGGSAQELLQDVFQKGDFSSVGEITIKIFFAALFFLWWKSGTDEYKILKKWVRTPTLRPQRPIIIMFTMIGLGAYFGLLTAYAAKLHIVFFMFSLFYLGIDIYTWVLRRGEIGGAIKGALSFFKRAVPSSSSPIKSEELRQDNSWQNVILGLLKSSARPILIVLI